MSPTEFTRRIAATGMLLTDRTAVACRLVLVDGLTAYAAAKDCGINQSVISRGLHVLRRATPLAQCPKCGHDI